MQLIKYFIIVFTVSFFLVASGTWVTNKGLTRSGVDFYGKINAALDSSKESTLLVIGSSRVLVHLDPKILDSATGLNTFNYGLNAGSIKTWFNIARCALDFQKKAQVVLLNIDYTMFDVEQDPYKGAYYYPFEKKTPGMVIGDNGNNKLVHNFKLFDVSLYDDYAKYAAIDGWLRPGRVLDGGYKGYYPKDEVKFELIPDSFMLKKKITVSAAGIGLLSNFIELCKEHNTKLVLIQAPYLKQFSPEKYSADFTSIISNVKKIAKEANIPFYDYTEMDLVNSKEYFYNVYHLNHKGATIYSYAVGDSIAKYLRGR
jgi:hypothetical protein